MLNCALKYKEIPIITIQRDRSEYSLQSSVFVSDVYDVKGEKITPENSSTDGHDQKKLKKLNNQ